MTVESMVWIYAGTLLALSQYLSTAQAAGILEVRLLSYINELSRDSNGQCCNSAPHSNEKEDPGTCQVACRPFFRICLKEWQNPVSPDPPCYFGSRITDSVEANGAAGAGVSWTYVDFSRLYSQEQFQFPFSSNWPGTMSLIVEVWHGYYNNASSAGDKDKQVQIRQGKQLLLRVAELRELQVGYGWRYESHSNDYSTLELQYRAICDHYYYGHDCTRYCRPRDDQYGHHICTRDGRKQCKEGWTGPACNKAICKPGCHPKNGRCSSPGECQCYLGYQGELCDQCVRYPGCVHGTCQRSFECQCKEGWGGLFCNQDLNFCTHHKPCKNGGTCINTGSGHYTCQCRPEYTGTNCELPVDTCAHAPCLNGGTCMDKNRTYACECPLGFSGRRCQSNARTCQDAPCENGGTCLDDQERGYICLCAFGYHGTNCDVERDECGDNPCRNGGTCINRRHAFPSSNSRHFGCSCPVGYQGPRCEINVNDCSIRPCLNGGTCVDLVGSFLCHCPTGFMGPLCQHNIDDCLKRPCTNGGICIDRVNDYHCMCRPGFRGKDCTIDVDECQRRPCRNGGTCIDLIDSYQCRCPSCFTGLHCQQRNDDCLSVRSRDMANYDHSTGDENFATATKAFNGDLAQSMITIGIPILVILVIVLLVLSGMVIFLYRKSNRRLNESDHRPMGTNRGEADHRPMGTNSTVKMNNRLIDFNRLNLHQATGSIPSQCDPHILLNRSELNCEPAALETGQTLYEKQNCLTQDDDGYKAIQIQKLKFNNQKNNGDRRTIGNRQSLHDDYVEILEPHSKVRIESADSKDSWLRREERWRTDDDSQECTDSSVPQHCEYGSPRRNHKK